MRVPEMVIRKGRERRQERKRGVEVEGRGE